METTREIFDILRIYNEGDWRLCIWNATEQQEMILHFSGSEHNKDGKTIHFNVSYKNPEYHKYKWKWIMFKSGIQTKYTRLYMRIRSWFKR